MSALIVVGRGVPGTTPERVAAARAVAPRHELLIEPGEAELGRRIGEVEAAFSGIPAPLVPDARNLRWVQLGGAGAEGALSQYPDQRVVLTNASGVHAVPISEHILAFLFAFARGMHGAVRAQSRHEWRPHGAHELFELRGKRLLVIGAGAIGAELVRMAAGLGMSVVGLRRSVRSGAVPGALRTVGPEALAAEVPEADFVALTVPLTPATRLMFGVREIALMKRSAFFVNIGRGKTVDQPELVRALKEGRIAGAGLDVFEEEPLPAASPLWDMENVIVTAHYSGQTPCYGERLWGIFIDNLGRFARGEPLVNVVDREEGY